MQIDIHSFLHVLKNLPEPIKYFEEYIYLDAKHVIQIHILSTLDFYLELPFNSSVPTIFEVMKRLFLSNILILLVLNLLVKPLYIFGIDVQVQNSIGPEQYGLFFSIFNYTLLFQFVIEYGITNYVKREVSLDNRRAPTVFSGILLLKLGLALLYFLLIIAFAWAFNYTGIEITLVLFVGLIQFLLTMVSFLRGIIIGMGRYRADSVFSVIDKAIMIVLLGWKLYWPGTTLPDLNFFMMTYLLSVAITFFLALIFLFFVLKVQWARPDRAMIRQLLIASTPYALITFLMGAYGRLDAVLLHSLLADGDFQAGIYAAGFRMLDAYMMFALLFANLLLPMLSSKQSDEEAFTDLMRFVTGLVMAATIIIGVGGFVFRREISELLYHHSDEAWYNTLGLLFLTMIPVGLSTLYGTAILSIGRLKRMNILFSTGILLSIVLNLILIPEIKSEGAAVSALCVNSIIALGETIIFQRESGFKPGVSFLLKLMALLIISFAIFSGIYLIDTSFWLKIGLGAIAMFLLAIALGMIQLNPRRIRAILSEKWTGTS